MAEFRTSKTWSLQSIGIGNGVVAYTGLAPAIWDPLFRLTLNFEFGRLGQVSEYVAVVQGRIGRFATTTPPMTVKIGLGTEPQAGPVFITPRPNSIHSIQVPGPLPGVANTSLPFCMVERFTLDADDPLWQLACRIESAQAGSIAWLEGVSVTVFSLDHLTPSRFDWGEFSGGITLPRATGSSGPSGADPAWEIPLANSTSANFALGKWACFYTARINPNHVTSPTPGIALTPPMVALRMLDPLSRNDLWPGPILPRYGLRGMYRRMGSIADNETRWMLGGCNVVEITEANRGVGVVGQDIQNTAICTHAAVFSLKLDEIAGDGFTSVDGGPNRAYEVYKDRFFASDAEVDDTYRLTIPGEVSREGSYFAEVVYPPAFTSGSPQTSDILDHDVMLSLEPLGADRRPIRERPAPLHIIRKRFEPVPDYRSDAMPEVRGPMAIELAGQSIGRTFPGATSQYRSEAIIRAAGFTVCWFRDFVGVVPESDEPEEPGPFVQVFLAREGPAAADMPAFPVPPMNAATGSVYDPAVTMTTVDRTELSWPLTMLGLRMEWVLDWTIDTKRHPDRYTAMLAFLEGPMFPYVRWQSPDADVEKAFVVLPESVATEGPRNGLWKLRMSVFEITHLEDPA